VGEGWMMMMMMMMSCLAREVEGEGGRRPQMACCYRRLH